MKATVWLWPFVTTLLCISQFVCTAQREFSEYADSNMIQDDFMLTKRTKPSLSIVNPLDVLRQRLLLEIARRQMRENTKQVEINRAILKNVGKRTAPSYNQLLEYLRNEEEEENINNNRILNNNIMNPSNNNDNNLNRNYNNNNNNKNNNDISSNNNRKDSNDDDDYQLRYLYSLRKNRFTKK